MKAAHGRAFAFALALHAGVLLFGGLLLFRPAASRDRVIEGVDLVGGVPAAQEPAQDQEKAKANSNKAEPPEEKPELTAQQEAPNFQDLANLNNPINAAGAGVAALEALSLSDLESVLNPGGANGGGAFGESFRLSSGGVIGGQGAQLAGDLEAIFSMSDLDQKPRLLLRVPPSYPVALRQKHVAGEVSLVFVVDRTGKVSHLQVEKSSEAAFERAALDAVKQWRFEPGVRDGQKVNFKMRVPIKFQPT